MSNSTSHLGGLGYPDVNNGPSILVATTITTMLALAVVLARVYVRLIIVRNFGLDVSAKHLHQVLYGVEEELDSKKPVPDIIS
jgi:hypothetical protein